MLVGHNKIWYLEGRRKMYERSTDTNEKQGKKKIQSAAEDTDNQGMGKNRQRSGNCGKISDTPSHVVSLEKSFGKRSRDFFKRHKTEEEPEDQGTGAGEQGSERCPCATNPGTDGIKKKAEFNLTGRQPGQSYTKEQKARIIQFVDDMSSKGTSKVQILKKLNICRSTYYSWFKQSKKSNQSGSVLKLTASEACAVIDMKKENPHLSHRKISGYLRADGVWVSPSSCYRILKSKGWIQPQQLREAPWKTAHYEPWRPNQIWGEDWTIINIAGLRYYLLTVIDFFSRYIVAWGIVKRVTQKEIRDIIALAYMSEGIGSAQQKTILRVDRGSPNMAAQTKKFVKDIEMSLSPARANRPTDNGRQERWYRTAKQEEIYCYPTYIDEEAARFCIKGFIEEYNEKRPHQALLNFTPAYVHRIGNKTQLVKEFKMNVAQAVTNRIEENRRKRSA